MRRSSPPSAREPRPTSAERRVPSADFAVANQSSWLLLLTVWLTALAVRCLYVWQISSAPFYEVRIGDAEAYHLWAQRIVAGDWIGNDVFYQAPLYPYFVALIYRALDDSATTVRLVQACIGATSCALLALAGVRLFGHLGALAGLLLAIYPPAIFLDGLLEKSSLVTFFMCALLAALAGGQAGVRRGSDRGQTGVRPGSDGGQTGVRRGSDRPHTRESAARTRQAVQRWLLTGVILALLTLTRENALLLIVPVLFWLARSPASTPPGAKRKAAIACVIGCGAVLIPVAIRNLAVGGELHVTTSQFGPNFYIGNHPGANGTYDALIVAHGSATDERQDATRLAERESGRKLMPAEVSAFWTHRALDYIRSQPAEWVRLMGRKFALTFNAAEIADTESQSVYAEWSSLLRLLTPFNFGVLLALSVLGTVLTIKAWARLWFLYAIAVTYVVSVVAFYVFARYRFPLVPALILLAAGGLLSIRTHLHDRRLLTMAIAASGCAAAFSLIPLENEHAARATHYFDIAATLAKNPARRDEAMTFYVRALDEAPGFPAAESGLGALLALGGRTDEAVAHYRAALARWPAHTEVRYNLGLALAQSGHTQEAADQLTEAARLRPDDAEIHVALAKVLLMLNRSDQAVEQYRMAIALEPKYVKAIVGLGVALAQLGRPDAAIEQYQIALAIDPDNAEAHNNLGGTLANEGRIAEALPHFERAVELNAGDEKARENLRRARQLRK
jgi:tetratricopeptide (TPR) repeat protein